MERIRVGGRYYSDPDVIALIRATGGLSDPRSLVLTQARKLNARYRQFESEGVSAFLRLTHIASMMGLEVLEMSSVRRRSELRDAVILMSNSVRVPRGQIYYNPDRPMARVCFSIAHEISHTFFPAAGGARFREMCNDDSREGNELERLCDLGASELLMPIDEFRSFAKRHWSIESVPRLSAVFGSSFEATVFRLASAHPGIAAAGLLRYRRRKGEDAAAARAAAAVEQTNLFKDSPSRRRQVPDAKYRRQSFHSSEEFPEPLSVRWNKSFDEDSVVYRARATSSIVTGRECLPNGTTICGRLEVIQAPYQREDADVRHPDLLFLWVKES